MRFLLLSVIVAAACTLSIFRPKLGLLFYIWFAIVRPDSLAWNPGSGFSMALAVVTLVGTLRYLPRLFSVLTNPLVILMLLLSLLCFVSTVQAVNPSLSYPSFYQYSRMVIMALLIPFVLQTFEDVKWCLYVVGGSLGFIGAKLGIFGLLHGGVRYAYGYSEGFLSDNNGLALAMVMALPICWYSISLVGRLWAKLMFGTMSFLLLTSVVMTHSRGGVLAAGAVIVLIARRSKRKLIALVLLLVLSLPSALLVRNTFFDRMSTIATYEEEASARSRIVLWKAAIRMWSDHPITGVGFGTLNERALLGGYVSEERFEDKVIHNTYLQMLVDSGIFAFLVYMLLIVSGAAWLEAAIRRNRGSRPDVAVLCLALEIALAGFAVGSFFISRVDFDLTYMLAMQVAALQLMGRREKMASAAAHPAQLAAVGSKT